MENPVQAPKVYNGDIIHQRFAYRFLRDNVNALGDIIAFRAPMHVEAAGMIDLEDLITNDFIYSDDAINFCWEIPGMCPIGAVAFQRLLNTQIANILYGMIQKPIEVRGDDLIVHDPDQKDKGKCSVSITYVKNGAALGHTGINVSAGRQAPDFAYSTKLTDEQCDQFMRTVVQLFYDLLRSLFIATTKCIA